MRQFIIPALMLMMFSLQAEAQHGHRQAASGKDDSAENSTAAVREGLSDSTEQHEGHQHHMPAPAAQMQHTEHSGHDNHGHSRPMASPAILTVPMTRTGSATSWLPDNSPMYAKMWHTENWMFMLHGNVFPRYTAVNFTNKGMRDGYMFDAPNWIMFMGSTKIGANGQFMFSGMFSLDPLTEANGGYPLLFQTGETYQGQPLIDKQHPHDLISELAVGYSHRTGENSAVFAYFGLPGEPALGPAAFMHRTSALNMPDAPLGHHWQDATHIVFGVATLGFQTGIWKFDASVFKGREPDENRYNIDMPQFDSYSARISANPNPNTAVQISYGFLKSPEAHEPDVDVQRMTASVMYHSWFRKHTVLANSLIWGVNTAPGETPENSFILESDFQFSENSLYTRIELIQKDGHELALPGEEWHGRSYWISALNFGGVKNLVDTGGLSFGLGAQFSLYVTENELENFYGKNPVSGQVFLRVRPARMFTSLIGIGE